MSIPLREQQSRVLRERLAEKGRRLETEAAERMSREESGEFGEG
jgi:ribose 1,5-bisphosphokinase PhnN